MANPSIGPTTARAAANLIIGHTTPTTARIWIRGNQKQRHCSVILEPGEKLEQRVGCDEARDYTGVVDFDGLQPGTEYAVTATFSPESAVAYGRVCTPRVPVTGEPLGFSFILSSCNLSVVSINNFLAFLLATAGTSVATTSLKDEPDRWNAPRFASVRRVWRWALDKGVWGIAFLVNWTTGIKQPGPPYLRSPFLKLAAIFDAWILEVVPSSQAAHFAVGDAVFTSRAKGLIAARFAPESAAASGEERTDGSNAQSTPRHPPLPHTLVVVQTEGQFAEESLYRAQRSDHDATRLGTITKVSRAAPWYERPAFFIHAGDQIYYDFPNGDRPPDKGKYRLAYREAWFDDEPNRYLLSHWPQYMTLDDHEIVDQFALNFMPPTNASPLEYLNEAGIAYREYVEALHPAPQAANATARDGIGPFWYTFDRLVYDASPENRRYARFFVLDTRTRRSTGGAAPQLIDGDQMRQLLSWMQRYNDDLKFVVTSVPFVAEISEEGSKRTPRWPQKTTMPIRTNGGGTSDGTADATEREGSGAASSDAAGQAPLNRLNDKWSAAEFARQRGEIIEFIADHQIEQLVFLTGDMHCCYHATMRIGGRLKYDSITIHELAGGPVNQLQLADIGEFNRSCRRRTTDKGVEYEVALDRFHSEVNGVLHLKVRYDKRDQVIGGQHPYAPEVEWNVIRTLTETEQSAWAAESAPAGKGPAGTGRQTVLSAGEPIMRGRISFTRRRTVSDLHPWE
jgi:hypothetical protein